MTRRDDTRTAVPPGPADPRRPRADRARQVADVLRRQVLHGDLRSGALPAEAELVREFGASRNTVREALALLRAEGLIERCPGVGTHAVAEKYPHGLERLLGLAETLREHGEVANEVRMTGLLTPSREVASRLRLRAGEQVVYIERIRRLNGLPLSLDLTYIPRDLGEPLLAEDLVRNDIFVLLERIAGRPLGRAEVTLEAVNADPHSAATLDAPRGAALLMLERLTHLSDGRPVDLEFIRFRGDRITMSGSMNRA